jgi:asparagine synthase (glutamine-hydrolysing)
MCGIAGFIDLSTGGNLTQVLREMTGSIAHRGPDGEGFFNDGCAYLGHSRLSIIDVTGGHQPMTSETGERWVVYNGELYNHTTIRPELEAAGHRYKTRCDTETILHAFEQYDGDCVRSFRGMFSFALWDKTRRRLFCARDRLGIKPFYYYFNGTLFAFASEIKALLRHPAISPQVDESVLPEHLAFGFGSGEKTLYRNIRQLMPGHTLTLTVDPDSRLKINIEQYWDVPEVTVDSTRSDQEWIDECRRRLTEAVRTRLMSDVPLGMFLSGGVDSSAIAALMKGMTSESVQTFAVGYNEGAFSELSYARAAADYIGTNHHEIVIDRNDFMGALPKLIWHEDKPLAWPSSVSLYFVSKLASERVKVVLTGEGSDELFGGYSRYQHHLRNHRAMQAYRIVPAAVRNGIRRYLASSRLLNADARRKIQHTFLGCDDTLESLYLDNFLVTFPEHVQRRILSNGLANSEPVYANYLSFIGKRTRSSLLSRLLYSDQKTYLSELLMKQDRMSMAASIESRVPFLDHPFTEFAASVPDRLRISGGTGKSILKSAVSDLLPHDITYRRKMGFPTPIRSWLTGEIAKPAFDFLCAPNGWVASYIDLKAVSDLIDAHQSGREDGTDRLWRLLTFQVWGHTCMLNESHEAVADRISPGLASAHFAAARVSSSA